MGKSSIGRRLARSLGVPFTDTDRVVEAQAGCTVAALFEREGEAAFRAAESEALADALDAGPGVVATGGGIVIAPANRERLQRLATVVYLRSSAAALATRLRHDTRRPLLQGSDVLTRLERLLAERDPLYRGVATRVVDAEGSTVSQLAMRIEALLHGAQATPRESGS